MSKTVFWFLFLGLVALFVGCTAAGQPVEEVEPTALPAETAVATPTAAPTAEDRATPVHEVTPIVATAPVTEEVTVPVSPTIPMPSNPSIQQWITQAKEDLAGRLNIDMQEIDLIEFKAVVWPDGSLGCPQPGMAYIQVLTEGYLIRLQVGKRQYEYHGGGNQAPFLCEQAAGDSGLAPPPGLPDE